MSQPRVTDFFSLSKRAAAAPRRASKQRTRPSLKAADCSSAVHQEFLRVIEEAAGSSPAKGELRGLSSPKRTAEDSTFDLGAAVFSATIDHSAAKKRRAAEARASRTDTASRRTARKKLVLLQDEAPSLPSAAAEPSAAQRDPQPRDHGKVTPRRTTKALGKEDLASLKARLQTIKKHAAELPSVSSSSPTSSTPLAPPPPAAADAATLRLARAKELAAKVQKRTEERETPEDEQQSEVQPSRSSEPPAYQSYHSLAQAGPPSLSLPYSYKVLAEMFRSMDTVVAMLFNRRETATFAKIKQGVQDMMHKRFEENHVGQIKMVFPDAFIFRQEKNIPTFTSSFKKGSYQLTMEPLLPSDKKEAQPVLSASRLLERRHVFHSSLLSIVQRHHKVFLSSLVPPLSVPEDQLTRWHPRFKVDSVPAVTAGVLPQAPDTGRAASAQEVLDRARSLLTPKMEKALVSLTLQTGESPQASSSNTPDAPQTPASPANEVPTALKGVSQSLLDRIRAKEAQKLQAAMTRNPDQEERLLMMSRLGELARILRSVFVAEKKPALIMEMVCNRMMASYRSALNTGEMEKHVRLLAEVAADWLTLVPVRKDLYLKLNKNTELSVVLDKLSHRLREEERQQRD